MSHPRDRDREEKPLPPGIETDSRFPSGEWTGFFLQRIVPGRHWMDLHLIFRNGILDGEGRDWVGKFLFKGRYSVEDGRCHWTKTYIGKHSIFYKGFNEGKGIWGTWEYEANWKGGFYIWPIAMGDPTQQKLAEALEAPVEVEAEELMPVGAESGSLPPTSTHDH